MSCSCWPKGQRKQEAQKADISPSGLHPVQLSSIMLLLISLLVLARPIRTCWFA